jgi:hypothetical protein
MKKIKITVQCHLLQKHHLHLHFEILTLVHFRLERFCEKKLQFSGKN